MNVAPRSGHRESGWMLDYVLTAVSLIVLGSSTVVGSHTQVSATVFSPAGNVVAGAVTSLVLGHF